MRMLDISPYNHGGVEDPGPAQHGPGPPQSVLHRQDDVDPLEDEDGGAEEERELGETL